MENIRFSSFYPIDGLFRNRIIYLKRQKFLTYRQVIENDCLSISWLYEVTVIETIKPFISCDVHLGSESSKQITRLFYSSDSRFVYFLTHSWKAFITTTVMHYIQHFGQQRTAHMTVAYHIAQGLLLTLEYHLGLCKCTLWCLHNDEIT